MKAITVNVSEPVYREFQRYASALDRTTSELIREAMEDYLDEKLKCRASLKDLEPISLGKVLRDTTFLVQHDVREAPFHGWSRAFLAESVLGKGHTPGLCPQVLSEYLHVITDPQRFEHPLSMGEALARTTAWWSLPGMRSVFPSQRTSPCSSSGWARSERSTMLAATYASNGYHCLLTTDRKGFALFEGVSVLAPPEGEGTSRSRA